MFLVPIITILSTIMNECNADLVTNLVFYNSIQSIESLVLVSLKRSLSVTKCCLTIHNRIFKTFGILRNTYFT